MLELPRNGWKWLEISGTGWNSPWFVPFQPLVQYVTGFDDNEADKSNGLDYILNIIEFDTDLLSTCYF